ncbi:hypothetical protein Pyn_38293 [Prunus yedoensis var. nudiflora]|uniref:Uncharacterized protein n=1 Tax=Prunus yedoensis var. nudiflora TaxID=2094558 RepID=A0A314YCM1_PRUYE|nr:hypothetical protein Pyn_38293 [Prunus yedoensis var. nudiflora]
MASDSKPVGRVASIHFMSLRLIGAVVRQRVAILAKHPMCGWWGSRGCRGIKGLEHAFFQAFVPLIPLESFGAECV